MGSDWRRQAELLHRHHRPMGDRFGNSHARELAPHRLQPALQRRRLPGVSSARPGGAGGRAGGQTSLHRGLRGVVTRVAGGCARLAPLALAPSPREASLRRARLRLEAGGRAPTLALVRLRGVLVVFVVEGPVRRDPELPRRGAAGGTRQGGRGARLAATRRSSAASAPAAAACVSVRVSRGAARAVWRGRGAAAGEAPRPRASPAAWRGASLRRWQQRCLSRWRCRYGCSARVPPSPRRPDWRLRPQPGHCL